MAATLLLALALVAAPTGAAGEFQRNLKYLLGRDSLGFDDRPLPETHPAIEFVRSTSGGPAKLPPLIDRCRSARDDCVTAALLLRVLTQLEPARGEALAVGILKRSGHAGSLRGAAAEVQVARQGARALPLLLQSLEGTPSEWSFLTDKIVIASGADGRALDRALLVLRAEQARHPTPEHERPDIESEIVFLARLARGFAPADAGGGRFLSCAGNLRAIRDLLETEHSYIEGARHSDPEPRRLRALAGGLEGDAAYCACMRTLFSEGRTVSADARVLVTWDWLFHCWSPEDQALAFSSLGDLGNWELDELLFQIAQRARSDSGTFLLSEFDKALEGPAGTRMAARRDCREKILAILALAHHWPRASGIALSRARKLCAGHEADPDTLCGYVLRQMADPAAGVEDGGANDASRRVVSPGCDGGTRR